jgi:hypothetical protein
MGIAAVAPAGIIKRYFRNYWRKLTRIRASKLPDPFVYAADIEAVHRYLSAFSFKDHCAGKHARTRIGKCYVCKKQVTFVIDRPADGGPVNWRETLTCPICGLMNRWRSCLHVFDAICEPTVEDRIYLTETLSPVYQNLAARYPLLHSSEYFPGHEFGTMVETHDMPVRNEDVTHLTFDDSSFEIILCFDVLEHVPDYRAALKEFHRVLCKGGQLVLSVPFSHDRKTQVRARVDAAGQIEHLVEPCYYGDPLLEDGVLSYYDFGMELLDDLAGAGFRESFVACCYSLKWGYLNGNVIFIARKL